MPAVAPLHGIGGGREQGVVEEGQGFLESGAEELLQGLADALEAPNASPKYAQLRHRGGGSAAPVEEPVDLVHDFAERSKFRQASGDPRECSTIGGAEALLHKEMAMVEEVGYPLLETSLLPRIPHGLGAPGATAFEGWHLTFQPLSRFGHSAKHGLGQVGQDVEFADLVGHAGEDRGQRLRIQGRAVGGHPQEAQPSPIQFPLEPNQEALDVPISGVVFQDLEE
jgi:hypothetical protein